MKEERRVALLQFISSYIHEHGYSPTVREIQYAIGAGSTSTVYKDLRRLSSEGVITLGGWGSPRTIRVVTD